MRLIGWFLTIMACIMIIGLAFVGLRSRELSRSRLKVAVVLEYKSPEKWIVLEREDGKRFFLQGERAKLIWYEHQVGDTLRTEELR